MSHDVHPWLCFVLPFQSWSLSLTMLCFAVSVMIGILDHAFCLPFQPCNLFYFWRCLWFASSVMIVILDCSFAVSVTIVILDNTFVLPFELLWLFLTTLLIKSWWPFFQCTVPDPSVSTPREGRVCDGVVPQCIWTRQKRPRLSLCRTATNVQRRKKAKKVKCVYSPNRWSVTIVTSQLSGKKQRSRIFDSMS